MAQRFYLQVSSWMIRMESRSHLHSLDDVISQANLLIEVICIVSVLPFICFIYVGHANGL